MMKRRDILKGLLALPLPGGATGRARAASRSRRDIFAELGLRTFINAAGTYTSLTGSLLNEAALAALLQSSQEFVMLEDVQDKVGARIAALCHAEAATVTAGCWSAMVLGLAGVLTGEDQEKVRMLPHLDGSGMKSDVILQKSHRDGYEHALTNTGVTLIPIETRQEAENAISERTALLWFMNREAVSGQMRHGEWLELARKHHLPTMIDIAADVPPVENLWKFNEMGFDLVCLSGGKALCGPQSAGILMGKKELIAAARMNGPLGGGNIGRGMKVSKEEIISMYVALDNYIKRDHAKEWKIWEDRIAVIQRAITGIKHVQTAIVLPPIANHTPTLEITWDSSYTMTGAALAEKLRHGTPSIEVISGEKDNAIRMTVLLLKPGQEKIVAARVREELLKPEDR